MPLPTLAPLLGQLPTMGGGRGVPGGLLLAVAVVAVGLGLYLPWARARRKREDVLRLLARDPSLRPTQTACGLGARALAGRFAATPRGDRRFGLRYGVTGPMQVEVAGGHLEVEAACFQWWWEERRTSSGPDGPRPTFTTRRQVALVARLPVVLPADVRIGPESLLGRIGITRGGQQLESAEFNRRFRVRGRDPQLTVQLLDAAMQQRLLTEFQGRSVELLGALLAIGGRPSHRDPTLTGVIAELPAVRQDLARLLATVPVQFWRAVGALSSEPDDPPPVTDQPWSVADQPPPVTGAAPLPPPLGGLLPPPTPGGPPPAPPDLKEP